MKIYERLYFTTNNFFVIETGCFRCQVQADAEETSDDPRKVLESKSSVSDTSVFTKYLL